MKIFSQTVKLELARQKGTEVSLPPKIKMNDSIGKVLQMGGEKNRKQENKSFRFSQYYPKPK